MSRAQNPGRSGTIIAIAVLATLVAGLIYRYWPSDERAIRRHLSNLAEALSLTAAESEVLTTTRFAALSEYLAPDIVLRVDDQELRSREVILARLRAWTPPPGGITVEFIDVTMAFRDGRKSADVDLTANVAVTGAPATDTSGLQTEKVHLVMVQQEGDWVISNADVRGTP